MTKIERFEDIIAWQKARIFVNDCYAIFGSINNYSFRDQILRAVISIMNNIAEGFDRKGNKEFIKFLFISKGSCAEVRSMLYLALDLRLISEEEFNNLRDRAVELSKILQGLIRSINSHT